MTTFVKAVYHPTAKAAEFVTDDGRHCIRTGGSLPWRIFNYGDLASPVKNGAPAPKKTEGFIGFAKPEDQDLHFFIFPTYKIGRRDLKKSLRRKYNEKTLAMMVSIYAPPSKNNTEKYINDLSKLSGIGRDERIKDLNDRQLDSLMDGIGRIEGYDADAATRKEIWVNVSHIQATDGTRPISQQELTVRGDGQERIIKSSASGQFPPIVHGKSALEIFQTTISGELKKIGELLPNEAQRINFVSKISEYVGFTAPVKPISSVTVKREPLKYVVKPNDQLGYLAKRFSTTVEQIKKDNRLVKLTIYPGQILFFNGNAPLPVPTQTVKRALKRQIQGPQKPPKTVDTPSTATVQPVLPSPIHHVVPEEERTLIARSKQGAGEPLGLVTTNDKIAPWMQFAIHEAKRHKGANEAVIEGKINYHVEIRDGRKTLVGSLDAWCAAFVNWCLMKSGYPIENAKATGFVDYKAAVARAAGFIHLRGKKSEKGQKYDDVAFVSNPLYYIIEKPVYGAIAIVTNASGHGHHAALVYGKVDENNVCILGGNQSQTIRLDRQNIRPVPAETKMIEVEGKMIKKTTRKAKRDHLVFLLPVAYINPKENSYESLPTVDPSKVNALLGISSANVTHSTRQIHD